MGKIIPLLMGGFNKKQAAEAGWAPEISIDKLRPTR